MAYYPTVIRGRRAPATCNSVFNTRSGFDRLFDRAFFDTPDAGRFSIGWTPVTDVIETKEGLQVNLELPGLSNEDVKVSVENGVLSISGEKNRQKEEGEEDSNYHLVERRYGRFQRTFRMPRGVNTEKVEAKFENGLLRIDIPKAEEAKKKEIEIK